MAHQRHFDEIRLVHRLLSSQRLKADVAQRNQRSISVPGFRDTIRSLFANSDRHWVYKVVGDNSSVYLVDSEQATTLPGS